MYFLTPTDIDLEKKKKGNIHESQYKLENDK